MTNTSQSQHTSYFIVAEFSFQGLGLAILSSSEKESLMKDLGSIFDELEPYSLDESKVIPRFYLENHIRYKFTQNTYVENYNHFSQLKAISNGDLTVSIIECRSGQSIEQFIKIRSCDQ